MKKREIPIVRLFLSFIITNIVFIGIFLVVNSISYYNYQTITKQNNEIKSYLSEVKEISSIANCENDNIFKASEIIDGVGSRIDLLELRFGKNDPRVLEQKNIYTDLEFEHLKIINFLRENCNKEFVTIQFLYSNIEESKDESEIAGRILSAFKKQDSERIMVYSFDFNLNNSQINSIKSQYNITSPPILIINEKEVTKISNIVQLSPYVPS